MQILRALRQLILPLAALAISTAANAGTNDMGLATIPFTIVNHTGGGGRLYVYVTGMVPLQGRAWFYLSDMRGNVLPVQEWTEPRSISLDLGLVETVKLRLPQLEGMRVYFSLGKPLLITAGANKIPGVPAGWVKSEDNANFSTIFDWTEFTWVDIGGGRTSLGGNATQVDMFGLAMLIQLEGVGPDFSMPTTLKSGFSNPQARAKAFDLMAQAGRPWSNLIMGGNRNGPTRLVSPYHGIDLGLFPKNELRRYVDEVFRKYRTERIIATVEGVRFTGQVSGGRLVFSQSGGGASFSFPKPDSRTVYMGGILADPQPADPIVRRRAGAVGALLQGAILRTTLLADGNLNACRRGQFYENEPVDIYAKSIHAFAVGGRAYGFGYDDTCEQSSYIGVFNPTSIKITLQPL